MPLTILIADEQRIMREGLKAILNNGCEFEVVAEAESGPEAIKICMIRRPDIVIIEIALPGLNGIDVTNEILRQCGETKIIILSMYNDERSVAAAIRAGAKGFVAKNASGMDLLDAVRKVAEGGSYLSSHVIDHFFRQVLNSDGDQPMLDVLAPREIQVLGSIAEGLDNKEIASLLGLSPETIRSYRKTMMRKLRVSNTAGLTRIALFAGAVHFKQKQDGMGVAA